MAEALSALERQLDEAIDAGVDFIQIRERDIDTADLVALATRVVARTGRSAVKVLVNDRADVALAAGAHGVHLRSDSPPSTRVRALAPAWILGRSVHQGESVADDAVDFLVFGPVFETGSKPGVRAAGLEAMGAAAAAAPVPLLAIGGVTVERARECVRHGAQGIAAIGLFLPPGAAPGALGARRAIEGLRHAFDAG